MLHTGVSVLSGRGRRVGGTVVVHVGGVSTRSITLTGTFELILVPSPSTPPIRKLLSEELLPQQRAVPSSITAHV